jgi:hypothetical protein
MEGNSEQAQQAESTAGAAVPVARIAGGSVSDATPAAGAASAAVNEGWAMTLYRRYVERYGDPIEQPIDMEEPNVRDR